MQTSPLRPTRTTLPSVSTSLACGWRYELSLLLNEDFGIKKNIIPFSFRFLFCMYTANIIFLCHYLFLLHFSQATISIKIHNFLICFSTFDLSCPILEKDNFIENVSCLIKQRFFFFKTCLFRHILRYWINPKKQQQQ